MTCDEIGSTHVQSMFNGHSPRRRMTDTTVAITRTVETKRGNATRRSTRRLAKKRSQIANTIRAIMSLLLEWSASGDGSFAVRTGWIAQRATDRPD